jgi:vancomycin permeability regulator SanA
MRRRITVRSVLIAACAVALLVVLGANVAVAESTRRAIFAEKDVPAMQTALVFGAGVEPDGSPSAMLGDRLDIAVRLYRAGKIRQILLSAVDLAGDRELPAMRSRLQAARIPSAAVLIDDRGFSTRDSCARARTAFGLRSATLVSQEYHLPRALFVCRMHGLDGVGVGAPDWGNFTLATMVPHALREMLATTSAVLHQYL